MARIRILIVDDSDDFLDGLSTWLRREPRLELVGKARSGRQALERADALHPDLVIMDVTMDDLHGFEVTRRIKARPVAPQVVLLTFHSSEAARLEAWAAGADGFVDKATVTEQLMPVIRDLFPALALGPSPDESRTRTARPGEGPRD